MNPRLLFAAYMAGGNATILKNLEDQISGRPDVSSAWLGVEMDAESKRLDRRPRRSLLPGTIRNSLLTGWEIGKLERQGGRFDAAWFFQQTICMFLWRFRSRVPYVVAMDGTPPWYARNGLWYTVHRFDPRSLSPGAGFTNMSDRLGAIGGSLRVESTPGEGTRILGTIPVTK